ncbi:MAG: ABC transporter ATP-binding protein [Lentisphaeria bacterium]|nr:ABC transporter ATP-binding protein/permease [Lentisphaeria bacterium]NQZ70693.1 ABC transporter ATP-binding protein [Lentisphaeria bacterium]
MVVVLFTCLKAVMLMAPPLIFKEIFDRVLMGHEQSLLFVFGSLLIILPLGIAITTFMQVLLMAMLGQRLIFDVRNDLFKHLESMSLRFYNKFGSGMLTNRLMGDTTKIQTVMSNTLIVVISDAVICVVAIIGALLLNWRLGCMLLLIVSFFVLNYRYLRKKLIDSKRKTLQAMDRMSAGVQERLSLNLTVRSYGKEDDEHDEFMEHTNDSVEYGNIAAASTVDFASNTELLTFIGWGAVYFGGCAMYLNNPLEMSYGSVIAFTTYSMLVFQPAVRFSNVARQVQDVTLALDRIFELKNEEPEVTEVEDPHVPETLRGTVEFNHVYFQYEKGIPVLRDFHLQVKEGETIALVGKTGCGKSTVLNLIFRFYDIAGGELKIDGVHIRDYSLRGLRKHFGIVLQEPMLFNASVYDNIAYANSHLPKEKIVEAAEMAEIHGFIEMLPDGYDTIISGEKGVSLSAGQQQQITIARAIASDPKILVMDEATSNLDSESEAKIQKALERILKGRTSFVIAHRLSTIRNATRIAFMDEGHILELGSHDELVQIEGGLYRELYEKHHESGVLDEGE